MKTSNKLIALLFALIFITIIGSGLVLKSRFDNIDRNDPYLGYIQKHLAPFKYVKLTGDAPGTVQLQPGETFEMRTSDFRNYNDRPKVIHHFSGDTLIVDFKRDGTPNTLSDRTFQYSPSVYISAPSITRLISEQIPCIVSGWKAGDIGIHQSGQGILFTNNNFENLHITARSGAWMNIGNGNEITGVTVILKDSSTFISKNDNFETFDMQLDDASHINIPSSLLKKSTKNNPAAK